MDNRVLPGYTASRRARARFPDDGRTHARFLPLPTFVAARRRHAFARPPVTAASSRWPTSRKTPSALSRAEAGARCPPTLSPATWAYLARHIERAFVRQGTRESLRRAVRRATAEMQARGIVGSGVCRALERAVTGHPACARFDRMLILTGEPYSRTVIATMQEWALAGLAVQPGGLAD